MNSFVIKLIAISCMLCDHIGKAFFPSCISLLCLGRCAFPLFAFQITQGYIHTHNVKKYFIRLLIFSIISQIPFLLFASQLTSNLLFNIFFTLFLGLLSIYIFDTCRNKIVGIISLLLNCLIGYILNVDYGAWGIIVIFTFFVLKDKKFLLTLIYTLLCIIKYVPLLVQYNFNYLIILYCIFTILPIIIILFYNNRKGPSFQKLFYVFYPAHLLILYIIKIFI